MSKKDVAIMDFGTQKITVVVGKASNTYDISISGSGEAEYAGFIDGNFIELDKLGSAMKQAIVLAESNSGKKITNLTLGIPASFCICVTKELTQNYRKRKKINDKLLRTLFEIGNDFCKYNTHRLICSRGTEYELDNKDIEYNPIGKVTSKLRANVTYILAENKFINEICKILDLMGIKISNYVCSAMAEAEYLLCSKGIYSGIIIDCGHISTSVAIVNGNGIVSLNEFALGGGFITSDLMKWLKLNYENTENLKRKAVLTISLEESDVYAIKTNNEVISIPALTTNNIIQDRIEKIIKTAIKCLEVNKSKLPKDAKVYLCGGGISYVKGAKELISRLMDKKVEILTPTLPQLAKPHYCSILSVLYIKTRM